MIDCDGCAEETESEMLVPAMDHSCGAPRPTAIEIAVEESLTTGICSGCGAHIDEPHMGNCEVGDFQRGYK